MRHLVKFTIASLAILGTARFILRALTEGIEFGESVKEYTS